MERWLPAAATTAGVISFLLIAVRFGLTASAGVLLLIAAVIVPAGMTIWAPRHGRHLPGHAEAHELWSDCIILRPFRGQVVGNIPAGPTTFQPKVELPTEPGLAGAGETTVHVVTGMPGVGKTELAARYARARLADGWRLVAWINAENAISLRAGLAAVADAVGFAGGGVGRIADDPSRAVKHRLETDGDRCLVVFDDARDPNLLRQFIPAGTAQVLITTAGQPTAELGTSVPVDVFTADQALAFLTGRTGLPEAPGATALAASLGRLPLALAMAAAVIAGQRLTYDGYLERLRQFPAEAYMTREAPPGMAEAVGLTLEAVQAADDAAVCTRVLEIMAVLSAAGVRRDLLHSAGRMGILADRHRIEADRVDRALAELSRWSLLTFSLDGQTVMAHGLVTRVVRDGLTQRKEMTTACRAAASVLEARARVLAELPDRPAVRDVLVQVATLREKVAAELGGTAVPAGEVEELAKVLLRLRILALQHLVELGGNTEEAIAAAEPLTADLERILGPGHPDTLTTRGHLAAAYQEAGRIAEAVPLFEQVLAAREQTLGPGHPDTLTTRGHLAAAYQEAGRIAEAVPLLERTLAASERVLGHDHPRTLSSRDNLALACWATGRIAEAIPLLEHGLGIRERQLGSDHSDTLTTRNNLATAYWAAGRVKDAIPLHEQGLAIRERVLGPDHPDTLISANNLAAAYRDAGRAAAAIRLFEQVLAARERVLGPDHPGTVTTRNNLAIARSKETRPHATDVAPANGRN